MKEILLHHFSLKRMVTFLLLMVTLSVNTLAQTPQYYNTNTGPSNNVFPFGATNGQRVHWLIRAGTLNQPSPCPGGTIDTLYFLMGATTSVTFTNITVKLGNLPITSLPSAWYTTELDTVYFRASVTLSSTSVSWMAIPLDRPFAYDTSKGLIVDIQQCNASVSGMTVRQSSGTPYTRNYGVYNGGCPNSYSGQDGQIINFGVHVTPPAQLHQPDKWCNNFPSIPGSGVIWGNASVAYGDTVYVVGDGGGAATTMFRKYSISGNTWTTGTPMPGPKTHGDLATAGGKIYYIGGGSSQTVATPQTYVYNPATGTWSTLANIPTPTTGSVAESYQDSIIYCISGGWSSYLTIVQVYRVNSNTWTTATSLPSGTGRRSFAGGLWGNKIFVCAGYSATFRQDLQIGTINPANPLQITWAAGPNFSIATSRPGGTAIEGRFYIVVGEISGGYGNQMGRFDIAANTWLTSVTPKPIPTSNIWGVVSGSYVNCSGRLGIKIWVPGGSQNTLRQFDVFSDTCLTMCQVVSGVAKNNKNQIPETYALKQNYPNPFNPSTKISYLLPKASDVKIVVFDILGREVKTLVNEFKPAGTHTVEFNASNLASGVYLYRIEAGDFRDTKKMLLVK